MKDQERDRILADYDVKCREREKDIQGELELGVREYVEKKTAEDQI